MTMRQARIIKSCLACIPAIVFTAVAFSVVDEVFLTNLNNGIALRRVINVGCADTGPRNRPREKPSASDRQVVQDGNFGDASNISK